MAVNDLVQEFLELERQSLAESDSSLRLTLETKQLAIVERLRELRPLQDPMLIISRYRP